MRMWIAKNKEKEYARQKRNRSRPSFKAWRQDYYQRVKREVFSHYSGGRFACACCGETRFQFLCIDHLHGGGRKHLAEIRKMGESNLYHWLRRFGFPDGYQVLCHNCNMSKSFYGECPHVAERRLVHGAEEVLSTREVNKS